MVTSTRDSHVRLQRKEQWIVDIVSLFEGITYTEYRAQG